MLTDPLKFNKSQIWKKMSFYPHGTLVHFGWKKWWPNVVGMPRPTGPLIGKGVPERIS